MILNASATFFIILTVALVTLGTRALPFVLFPAGKKTPEWILSLGRALPPAMIGMLVVYCLKGASPLVYPYSLPEMFSVVLVVLLQLWRHNTLISICGGTACYMLLIQLVFA